MNLREVVRLFSLLLLVLSALLLAVAGWAGLNAWWGDDAERSAALALLISGAGGALLSGAVWLLLPRGRPSFGRREALLLVAISWLLGAALAAAPFRMWTLLAEGPAPDHAFHGYVDCYFEAMSGLTTTGATVLTKIHELPRSILLWRALTHWLGGLGIVVLFVAVLPGLGVGGKKLFRFEAPGPDPEGVRPHIRETARILWLIYLGLTVAEILALRVAGMDWFQSVCHTFATLATGGFSTSDTSIGGFHSVAIDTIIIFFMICAGVNFGVYYQVIRGRFRQLLFDAELHAYLGLILIAGAVVSICLIQHPIVTTDGRALDGHVGEAIQHGVFQAVSVQTTTGFCTADFNQWPFLAKGLMILLMFIGGSAGSTGGGLKVVRILICVKVLMAEIERVFRPYVVRPTRIGRVTIDDDLQRSTVAYVLGVIVVWVLGAGLLMLIEGPQEIDFGTAGTASVATLFNIGPGLGRVGAVEHYGWFTDASKVVMSLLMAIGRLEVFAIIVLFSPRFWRGH